MPFLPDFQNKDEVRLTVVKTDILEPEAEREHAWIDECACAACAIAAPERQYPGTVRATPPILIPRRLLQDQRAGGW